MNNSGKQQSFCSWSGGKDSCFSLYKALQNGLDVKHLFCMLEENGKRSRSHGLPVSLLEEQAASLGLPLSFNQAKWDTYEDKFINSLRKFKELDINSGIFGDIDLDEHREWCEKVCSTVEFNAHFPLWQLQRKDILNEFIDSGFKAVIVTIKDDKLDTSFLGKIIDHNTIDDFKSSSIDLCGENGEYHTFVFDGPIFSTPVVYKHHQIVRYEGYSFLEIY